MGMVGIVMDVPMGDLIPMEEMILIVEHVTIDVIRGTLISSMRLKELIIILHCWSGMIEIL